jgi:hypothetical protein
MWFYSKSPNLHQMARGIPCEKVGPPTQILKQNILYLWSEQTRFDLHRGTHQNTGTEHICLSHDDLSSLRVPEEKGTLMHQIGLA